MIVTIGDASPLLDPSSWTAPDAALVGAVEVCEEASVWYTSVVRGDLDRITIGARSNIQDGCVLHTDPGLHLSVGSGVTVGHRAVLHGCTIEDDVLVGMGAIVLNGAVVGTGSIVGAGTLITEGVVIPPRSLVVGAPGRVRRTTTDEELVHIRMNAEHYVELAKAQTRG